MAATNLITPAAVQAARPVPGTDIHEIRPPVPIPGWEWVLWILAGMALMAIVVAVIASLWKKRKAAGPPELPPAHVRARQKLEEALALIAQPKPFCILVSDTIRAYLEERFNFHAPDRTTEEFLHELKKSHLLTSDQKEGLSGFLQQCDLVKFARYEPGEPELRELHGSALRLVEETEPLPAGAVPTVTGLQSTQQPELATSEKS